MISIIIPVYNVAPYLDQCLESVIIQTYKDWECILIDDGSKDNSGEICDKWGKIDSRFRIIHQINQGVSAARNRGIKESRGEYIVFIDSDDWVSPNYLFDMLNAIDKNNDLVVSGNNHYYPNGEIETFKPTNKQNIELSAKNTSFFIKNIGLLYGPTSLLYKSTIIKNFTILFPTEYSLGEDLLFNFQYLEKVKHIQYIPFANYNYRIINSGSLTSIYRDNTFDIHSHQWKVQKDFLINKGMWNEYSQFFFSLKLWGIIYNGIFSSQKNELQHIKRILNIKEGEILKSTYYSFKCSQWIKLLIINKHYILLFLIIKFTRIYDKRICNSCNRTK